MKIKMNTKFTQGDIDISFHGFKNRINCTVAHIAHIAINEDGIVQGTAHSISIKDVELRDFLASLFDFAELFKLIKAENDIKKLEKSNTTLERKLTIARREVEVASEMLEQKEVA